MFLNKKALSLIEVLIVILILWFVLVSVLSVITRNFFNIDYVNTKSQATYFAKEWIEMVLNNVDSNIEKWMNRNCAYYNENYNCESYFSTWVYKIDLSFDERFYSIEETEAKFDKNILYYHTWTNANSSVFYYNHNSSWKETFFSRYLKFEELDMEEKSDDIFKINSIVEYKKWTMTWEVILESFISNVR